MWALGSVLSEPLGLRWLWAWVSLGSLNHRGPHCMLGTMRGHISVSCDLPKWLFVSGVVASGPMPHLLSVKTVSLHSLHPHSISGVTLHGFYISLICSAQGYNWETKGKESKREEGREEGRREGGRINMQGTKPLRPCGPSCHTVTRTHPIIAGERGWFHLMELIGLRRGQTS